MGEPETTPPRRRRWPLVATALVVLVTATGMAGKYWVIPVSARESFQETILHYWDGTVEIDSIEGGYFDPIRAVGLTLRDNDGRVWAKARSVTLAYTPLPSLSDRLCMSDIEGFEIILHVDKGACRPPVRNMDDFLRWLEQQFSVEKFTVRDGAITTQYDGKTGGVWDGLEFVCTRLDGGCDYTMALTRTGPNGREGSCDGRIDVDIKASWPDGGELAYTANVELEGLDIEQLLAAMDAPVPDELTGGGDIQGTGVLSGTQLNGETIAGEGGLKITTTDAKTGKRFDFGAVTFEIEGPLVTLRRVKVPLLAFSNPGWINLDTGELDVDLTKEIPFFGTKGVHYTGKWNVPGKLVKTGTSGN